MERSLTDVQQAALRSLLHWKAARPERLPSEALEQLGLVERLPTVLGEALVLSAAGRSLLGQSSRVISDTVAVNSIYRQDAVQDLQRAGYHALRPGKANFCVVTSATGASCPLLGRVTSHGYSKARVRQIADAWRTDLLVAQARLIVLMPVAELSSIPQVEFIYSPPRWM